SIVNLLDADSHLSALDRYEPMAVINTGAFTAVDGAEADADGAYALNAEGPGNLAVACARRGVPLIHMSTDCVFDGAKDSPYTPNDTPNPLGVYGKTKLQGEVAVREGTERSLVVRVSWIFSRFGGSFVRTMLRVAQTRDAVSVVSDQVGCPTHAPDLARALITIAEQAAKPGFGSWGVYHVAGAGETDRASMTRRIYEVSKELGGPVADVNGILTADYPTPAQRPLNARLDMAETRRVFGIEMPDWNIGLSETVSAIIAEPAQ
ncbi:MAG TPA: dTDP-4-dehydrorhamnose reductase, partial [Hyphomonas sp.]|nr:dTDP-4-dehydrorhamnose reductase [Hyphomonas sp.]